jgi:arylformamidase
MQQPPGAAPAKRGVRVFMDYTQAELDAAYDQSAYAPNRQQCIDRNATNSNAVRGRIGNPQRFVYGPDDIEKLDVYRTAKADAPVFVFIHGGAWRNGEARDFAFPAETLVLSGVHFVVPDFVLVQDAGGSLMPMAEQVRRAIAWVWKNAGRFGGDPNRLYLGGASSGAHLAACALIADWARDWDVPADIVKGAMLASGIYELAPVRLSARSAYVKFTDEMVAALSPMRHLDRITTPLILAYGTLETPEFQRQTRDFAAALKAAGKPVRLIVAENFNHFELPETLANPFGLLGRAVLEQIGIKLIPA